MDFKKSAGVFELVVVDSMFVVVFALVVVSQVVLVKERIKMKNQNTQSPVASARTKEKDSKTHDKKTHDVIDFFYVLFTTQKYQHRLEKSASRCRLLFRRRRRPTLPPPRCCERLLGRTKEVKETRVMPTHANADFYFRGEEITNSLFFYA